MRAGKLDRLIRIERPVEIRDAATNEVTLTYELVDQVWGSRTPGGSQERLSEGQVHVEPRDTVRIRYRSDLAAPGTGTKLRVVMDGVAADVVDVAEVGRREGLDLTVVTRGEP